MKKSKIDEAIPILNSKLKLYKSKLSEKNLKREKLK